MGEIPKRISRSDDEMAYQPRIHSKRIHQIYLMGQELKLPMTVILDQAIENFINQLSEQNNERSIN